MVIVSSSADSKYMAPLLAVGLEAGYASNVVEAPSNISPFTVKRTAFSNKAFQMVSIDTEVKLVGVSKNSFGLVERKGSALSEVFAPSIPENGVV